VIFVGQLQLGSLQLGQCHLKQSHLEKYHFDHLHIYNVKGDRPNLCEGDPTVLFDWLKYIGPSGVWLLDSLDYLILEHAA